MTPPYVSDHGILTLPVDLELQVMSQRLVDMQRPPEVLLLDGTCQTGRFNSRIAEHVRFGHARAVNRLTV
jgi:hypothetical protein